MIIYNVTVNVENAVREEWLQWMRADHIPKVMETGLFIEYRICKLIHEEEQGVTYAIQYTCNSMSEYENYISNHAPRLRDEVKKKYGDRLVFFRSLLEVL